MFDVTFVIPFFNEEKYLPATLASLAEQELNQYQAEILLVDGNSTDRSRAVAEDFARANTNESVTFSVLSNPHRRTPAGFNLGIKEASAPIIGFGGAHSHYPKTYLRTAVELLVQDDAGVVGGGQDEFIPSRKGWLAEAMSCLYQSPFGSGVAAYHRRREPGYVDTVYGGFYRRDVFKRIGLFNEELARNQDNELNARVTQAGFKILFHPLLSTTYIFKSDFKTFLKRGFLFGFYHPETWQTNPNAFRWRHIAPLALVVYLLTALPLFVITKTAFLLAPLALYLCLLVYSGVTLSLTHSIPVGLLSMGLFTLYHLSYGLGTLCGFAGVAVKSTHRQSHSATL